MDPSHVSTPLTRLILGVDARYRSERYGEESYLDREGLIPVHWSHLAPLPIDDWHDAVRRLQDCIAEAATLADPLARDWLTEQALAVLVLVQWLRGDELSYEQVVAGCLRVDPQPPGELSIRACRESRDQVLHHAGYRDYADFVERNLVPTSELEAVLHDLIVEAERRTRARLPHLVLPKRRIGVAVVSEVPFTAYCDYPGERMWISADVPHTVPDLKHLVGHEAYPGHYTHMGHRDAGVRAGAILDDAALVVTNTASSVLFEGIAERGLDLLNWRTSVEDRIAWLHDRLQWLCSMEAAHALNTGRRSEAEVRTFLQQACDGDEAWIDAKIRFVTHALRAPFVYGYWWGGTVVGQWLQRVPLARTDEAVAYLYDHMHSPTTLTAHWNPEASS